MAEIPVVYGPGGLRDTQTITSGTAVAIDLAAFVERYVVVKFDQAAYLSQIPATGTFTLSSSGAVAAAADPTSGALVPKELAASTELQIFVHAKYPRLLVRAQSTSITSTAVKVASDVVDQ